VPGPLRVTLLTDLGGALGESRRADEMARRLVAALLGPPALDPLQRRTLIHSITEDPCSSTCLASLGP
jgi:hypothetical protein